MHRTLFAALTLLVCSACVPMRIKELVPSRENPPRLRFFANRGCRSAPYGYFYTSPAVQFGSFGLDAKNKGSVHLHGTFRGVAPRTLAITGRPLTITYAGRAAQTVPFVLTRVQTRTHVDTKFPSEAGYDKTSTGPWRYHVVKKERSLVGLKSKTLEEVDYDYSPVTSPLPAGKPYAFRVEPGFESDGVAIDADLPSEPSNLRIELPIDDEGAPLILEFEYLNKWTIGPLNC